MLTYLQFGLICRWFFTWLWKNYSARNLVLWILLNTTPFWLSFYSLRHVKKLDKETKERYSAFIPPNWNKLTRNELLTYSIAPVLCFFTWPRLIYSWFIKLENGIFIIIFNMIFTQTYSTEENGANILHWIIYPTGRLHFYLCGVVWMETLKPEADYREWLGPEWTPKYTGAGMQVSNHSGWMDIICVLFMMLPSFISKAEIQRVPLIG